MGFLKRHADQVESSNGVANTEGSQPAVPPAKEQRITFLACFLGLVASIGGFMFGYVRYVDAHSLILPPLFFRFSVSLC